MDADILVITLAIRIALPVPQQETPEAAAVRPRTDVGQRLAIIPMKPVARLTVTKPDVPAGLIPVPMVAEVQEDVVLLALILNRLLPRLPVAQVVPAADQAAVLQTTVQEVVTQPSPAEQPDVVTAVLSEENTGLLHRHQPQKNAVAAAQPNLSLLSQDMPAVRYIMTDICPATMRSVRLHVPAEPLTSEAAAVAKQQKPLCFQRGFSFAQGSKI